MSVAFLEDVDRVNIDQSFADAINTSERFFRAILAASLDELRYSEEDISDLEWVMKCAGGRGKTPTEQLADALNASQLEDS